MQGTTTTEANREGLQYETEAQGAQLVSLADHPSNLDPTAELVSGSREPYSVFRVRGGFVAVLAGGLAYLDLFPSRDAAIAKAEGR